MSRTTFDKSKDVFSIDGKYFDIRIPEEGISRDIEVLDGENTERKTDGDMLRDIIGTYVNYTISCDTRNLSQSDYDELVEILTEPTVAHDIVIPYGQTTLSYKAYCTSAKDKLKRIENNGETSQINHWTGLSFSIIPISANRLARDL